ncbi:MAG: PaaI family thioesterase [Pseudomonadota bacterium]
MAEPFFSDSPDNLMTPAEIAAISGLEFIQGIAEGRYPAPPIGKTLDFTMIEAVRGRVVFEGAPSFAHYNPIGSVHGGWFGTLMDSCMACAVQSTLAAGQGYTTLEYKINILRPAFTSTGPLRAIGEAIHTGRRTATSEGRLVDGAGKLYATGTTTCLVFKIGA